MALKLDDWRRGVLIVSLLLITWSPLFYPANATRVTSKLTSQSKTVPSYAFSFQPNFSDNDSTHRPTAFAGASSVSKTEKLVTSQHAKPKPTLSSGQPVVNKVAYSGRRTRSVAARSFPADSKTQSLYNQSASLVGTSATDNHKTLLSQRQSGHGLLSTSKYFTYASVAPAVRTGKNSTESTVTGNYPSLLDMCSAFSCSRRCGLRPQIDPGAKFLTCGCDAPCSIYGDCCDDANELCFSSNSLTGEIQEAHKNFLVFSKTCLFGCQVITSCRAENSNTSTESTSSTPETLTTSTVYRTTAVGSEFDPQLVPNNLHSSSRWLHFFQFLGDRNAPDFLVADESQGLLFKHDAILKSCASVVSQSHISYISKTTIITCEPPIPRLSVLQIHFTKCKIQTIVDIPPTSKRPCCFNNARCEKVDFDPISLCQKLDNTNITLIANQTESCETLGRCPENEPLAETSRGSLMVSIRPLNAGYKVEFSGLIEKSLECRYMELYLHHCSLNQCLEGALLLVDSPTKTSQSQTDRTLSVAKGGKSPETRKKMEWIGYRRRIKRCVMNKSVVVKSLDLEYVSLDIKPTACACLSVNAALGNLGIWNAMTQSGGTCIIALYELIIIFIIIIIIIITIIIIIILIIIIIIIIITIITINTTTISSSPLSSLSPSIVR
ncbi:hypothetical protein ElyMa_003691900 [Elysia marginata]|uniref:SMB domain-containing protein n=1 Tax=Elysia marginata TaxID=1093978 RepID=A0AAV4F0K3_9GAST|nr:hypothetical protein ElyMa_003691900 [Elysia marginata]